MPVELVRLTIHAATARATSSGLVTRRSGNFSAVRSSCSRVRLGTKSVSTPAGETEKTRTLDASIEWLKANPSALVLIEGHCDERGTNAYNLVLGERRARAAQDYLTARGVEAARIMTISYSEERPGCTERNETCWARNRRAHFLAKQP